ncbi:hypothetical protein P0082_04195 [Candidatus Haliotispira prima]|uniref:VCBS repeat-containing protein n=1 Tax=Candidatus Haliotispira prima TaxID=3034016 RepID=A0ABY8MJ79_9SPIO|nr:hypothetical protein P0082_04195 [Candidatus Haliotispira prima]
MIFPIGTKNSFGRLPAMGKWVLGAICFVSLAGLLMSAGRSPRTNRPPVQNLPQSCIENLEMLAPQNGTQDYYSWENTREFSGVELQAIQSLYLLAENVDVQTENGQDKHQPSESEFEQAPLENGNFRTILPIRNVDGWNLFVLAERFAPDSNFIRSFVLLIEGSNGWQSRYLFPAQVGEAGQDHYEGGYDFAMYGSDLNYDGREELVFISHTGMSPGYGNSEILQVSQLSDRIRLELKNLGVPRLHSHRAEFQDGFLVRVQLKEENSPTLISRIPLAKQQEMYFDPNGKWFGGTIRPWLSEEPTHVQPVEWNCNNSTYELLYTLQPLKGLANADTIGYFGSFWMLQSNDGRVGMGRNGRRAETIVSVPQSQSQSQNQGKESRDSSSVPSSGWTLIENNFYPFPGNRVLEYESLLP